MKNIFDHRIFSFLKEYIKPVKKDFLLSMIFFQIKHSPAYLIPFISAQVIDLVTRQEGDILPKLIPYAIFFFIVTLQNIPMHTLFIFYLSKCARYIESALRYNLVSKFHQLSMDFHLGLSPGKIHTRIIRDVERIGETALRDSHMIIMAVTSLAAATVIILLKSPMMLIIYSVFVPCAVIFRRIFQKKIENSNHEYRNNLENFSSIIGNMAEMIPMTRAHGLAAYEKKKINKEINNVVSKGRHLDFINALFASSTSVIFFLTQGLFLFISVFLAHQGYFTVGEIVLFQGLLTSMIGGANTIIVIMPRLATTYESLKAVQEILDSNEIEHSGGNVLPDLTRNFEFQNLSFTYPNSSTPALKHLNFTIEAGKTTALVGPSGSGKSSIAGLLVGYRYGESGSLKLGDADIKDLNIKQLRNHIGIVSQNVLLFSGTIRENLTYGLLKPNDKQITKVLKQANIYDFVNTLPEGLDTRIGEKGGAFSGGELQRLAIARALIRQPRFIILDEATSSLDLFAEAEIQKAVDNLHGKVTVLIIAHRLPTVMGSDKIIVLNEGKIIEQGSPELLIQQKGLFFEMYKKNIQTRSNVACETYH